MHTGLDALKVEVNGICGREGVTVSTPLCAPVSFHLHAKCIRGKYDTGFAPQTVRTKMFFCCCCNFCVRGELYGSSLMLTSEGVYSVPSQPNLNLPSSSSYSSHSIFDERYFLPKTDNRNVPFEMF